MAETREKLSIIPSFSGMNKYIQFAFLVAFLLLYYIFSNLIESIWFYVATQNEWGVIIVSVIISLGLTLYLWVNPVVNELAKEIANELSKVTWPNKKETYAFTITVIVTLIIAAIILGLFDMIWAWLTGLVYS